MKTKHWLLAQRPIKLVCPFAIPTINTARVFTASLCRNVSQHEFNLRAACISPGFLRCGLCASSTLIPRVCLQDVFVFVSAWPVFCKRKAPPSFSAHLFLRVDAERSWGLVNYASPRCFYCLPSFKSVETTQPASRRRGQHELLFFRPPEIEDTLVLHSVIQIGAE